MDRRKRYTQTVIRETFTELLRSKPIEKITVTEICKLAEINRSTFYVHYQDAYDLLEKLEAEYGDKMVQSLASVLSEHSPSVLTLDISAIIRKIVEADEVLLLLAGTQPSSGRIMHRLELGLSEILSPRLVERYGFSEAEAMALYSFLFAGYRGMDEYFRSNEPADSAGLTAVINGIITRGLETRI